MEMGMDMSSMVNAPAPHPKSGRAPSGFLSRLIMLLVLSVAIIAGLVYLLYARSFRWVELVPSASAVICGIFAGLFSRMIYHCWPRFIRWIFACVASSAALAIAGLIGYQWFDIDLTGILTATEQSDFSVLSVMAAACAFLAVFAWRKKSVVVQPKSFPVESSPATFRNETSLMPAVTAESVNTSQTAPSRKMKKSILPETLRKQFRKNNWRRLKRKWKMQWLALLKQGKKLINTAFPFLFHKGTTPTRHLPARKSVSRLQIRVPERHATPPASSPLSLPRKHFSRKTHHPVRLIGKEELRCPYCLQIIEPHERKTMVVCPICHAAHHKECWEITGSCQVPHNHTVP